MTREEAIQFSRTHAGEKPCWRGIEHAMKYDNTVEGRQRAWDDCKQPDHLLWWLGHTGGMNRRQIGLLILMRAHQLVDEVRTLRDDTMWELSTSSVIAWTCPARDYLLGHISDMSAVAMGIVEIRRIVDALRSAFPRDPVMRDLARRFVMALYACMYAIDRVNLTRAERAIYTRGWFEEDEALCIVIRDYFPSPPLASEETGA